MAIKRKAGGRITGLAADPKPTAAAEPVNTIFEETDTGKDYRNTGTAWLPKSVEGGYRYIIFLEGSTYYCQDAKGKTVSSNASPVTVIQYALDNLTVGRTWKETVKLKGSFTFPTITVPSFTTLDLSEARLLQTALTDNNFIRNADATNGNTDIEIFGGIIDGNKSAQAAGGTEDGQSMLFFKKCSRVSIHHNTLKNGDFHNCRFRNCPSAIVFSNNISLDPRHEHVCSHAQGEAANSCRNHFFVNNYFENVTAGNSFVSTINVPDTIIANNTCQKTFDNTSGITTNAQRTIISNNTIRAAYQGIVIAQIAGSDYDCSGTIIQGNLIYDSTLHGITASVEPGNDVVITNNIIDTTLSPGSAGIAFSGFNDLTITGNTVVRAFGNGIMVYGSTTLPTKNILIANNICYNNAKQPAVADNNAAGIQVRSLNAAVDTNLVTVQNNKCYDSQGTKTQKWGIRLSLATDTLVRYNDVRGNLTAGCVYVSSVGTVTGANAGFD